MQADQRVAARDLIGALAWRTRREGLRSMLIMFVPFVLVSAGMITISLLTSVNGAADLRAVATRYGATAHTVSVGTALVLVPGLIAVFGSIAVAVGVRNLVGSESSRGGMELLLAGPYQPGSVAGALLGYFAILATACWAGMTAISAVGLVILVDASGGSLSLSAGYITLVVALPLLAVWDGTGLSLLVYLLFPRLAQAGQLGLATSGSGLAGAAALLPGLGVLLVFTFGVAHHNPGDIFAVAGGITAVVAAASTTIVARCFRPEAVLDT